MNPPTATPPRVSLVLLVFNQRDLLDAAARSCLAQQCEPLEIVFSDDASTDGSFERLQAIAAEYRGPHQVRVRRNPRNLGIGGHYNAVVADTRGELIVTAAGDDLSTPDRVHALLQAWEQGGCRADLLSSHFIDLDADGRPGATVALDDLSALRLDDWFRRRPTVTGATHAFTRRMMQRFGPFDEALWYEDVVMVFRALAMGGALTVPRALVQYRRDGTSKHPGGQAITADGQRAWIRRQNQRLLAEMRQLMRDAEHAGCAPRMREMLARSWQREQFLQAAMQVQGLGDALRVLAASPGVPLGWRLRKLLYWAWPPVAECSAALRRWRARRWA